MIQIQDNQVDMQNLLKGLDEIKNKEVIVGVLDQNKDIQLIASANEFGATIKSPKALAYMRMLAKKFKVKLKGPKKDVIIIPERSFIRSTFDDVEVQNKIIETMSFYLERALTAQNTFGEVLSRAGVYLQRAIQSRLANTPPKNHPLTIAMKGSEETLIGKTKNLVKSIKSKVMDKQ